MGGYLRALAESLKGHQGSLSFRFLGDVAARYVLVKRLVFETRYGQGSLVHR